LDYPEFFVGARGGKEIAFLARKGYVAGWGGWGLVTCGVVESRTAHDPWIEREREYREGKWKDRKTQDRKTKKNYSLLLG
jgi:hypothetical protein